MSKNIYSGFERKRVVAVAGEVTEVEFFYSTPNYFRVTNHGAGRLYFSANRIPTLVNYDFVCDNENTRLFTEPHGRDKLYIFNPTGDDCAVDIMSFNAAFDPLALAFSALSLDFSGTTIETSTAIDSFKSALPAGNNVIGKVGISGAIPAGDNTIGKVVVEGAELAAIKAALSTLEMRSRMFTHCKSGTATSAGVTYNSGAIIGEIAFLSNDGAADITLTITEEDGTVNSIVIKAGEVMNNIPCTLKTIKVAGNNVPFRLVYCERNGG